MASFVLHIEPVMTGLDTRVTVEGADWEQPLTFFLSELDNNAIFLPPGSYAVSVARAGLMPARQQVTITTPGDTLEITLSLKLRPPSTPTPAPTEPSFPRRAWAGAWSGVGGVVLVSGAPMLAVGLGRSSSTPAKCSMDAPSTDRCRADLARSTMLGAAGGGFLGSGVGVLIGGLTGLARTQRQRRTAWIVETSVGGLATLTGAILLGVAARSFNGINNNADPDAPAWGYDFRVSLLPSERGFFSGAVLLGAGVGLGTSALLGLVSPKLLARSDRAQARWHLQADGFRLEF